MPPEKLYIFEDKTNPNVRVRISAYTKQEALGLLEETVKYPDDFKLL